VSPGFFLSARYEDADHQRFRYLIPFKSVDQIYGQFAQFLVFYVLLLNWWSADVDVKIPPVPGHGASDLSAYSAASVIGSLFVMKVFVQ